MKKVILISLLTTTLIGCDYFNDTKICNQSGQEITLKITFDAEVVKGWSGGMLAENIDKTFKEWDDNLIPVNIDTINYISTYIIKPDSCAHIEGGNNRRPNFHFYKKLEIFTNIDTIRLNTKEEMIKAFAADRNDPKYNFDLLILKDGKHVSR
jgi:hypothetical protein